MSNQESPLTPKFRATAAMVARHNCSWEEATDLVEHTFLGRQAWIGEEMRELGRVIAKETPFRQILTLTGRVMSRGGR
jgi:hypothetical protein